MASVTLDKGRYLFEAGQPVNELFIILKGSVSLTFPGGAFILSRGEVPGICEISCGVHFLSCKALEELTVMRYPISDAASLEFFLQQNQEYGVLFVRSAYRQINAASQCCELAHLRCRELYDACVKDAAFYKSCQTGEPVNGQETPPLPELPPFTEELPLDEQTSAHYLDIERHLSVNSDLEALAEKEIAPIASLSADFIKLITSAKSLEEFKILYKKWTSRSKILFKTKQADSSEKESVIPEYSSIPEQLTDSLQSILTYSGAEDSLCSVFKDLIEKYRNMTDRNASDDDSRYTRRQITALFNKLYHLIFFQAVKDSAIPLPVRMFLYFGYVDETLAGTKNTACLAQLANQLASQSFPHTFTLFDWLIAILEGRREPSRNEFDEDYTRYLHNLKTAGTISASDERELTSDTKKKVEYELENMFPQVNKMTSGRIASFCPVFSDHNVLKAPDASLVTGQALQSEVAYVKSMDFGAYYREYTYTNINAGIPRELFHAEALPDFILMPCVGTRGVMWQEIEGRRRTTSARMMLPLFYMDDLRTAVIRLTGEYRWEICKRIQGARWNDLSEHSLTSEYFDYIQFYKKNHDLSVETKEKIKLSLQKARGNFKEMFVRDYITYIFFERTGSPRLTKIARSILFTYCPFTKSVRSSLAENPIFRDLTERYELRKKQQLHKLELLKKRVESSRCEMPQELLNEENFLNC